MRAVLVLVAFGAVLQQPQPSPRACMAAMKKEARIVIPFGYDGAVCYETISQSFVCESAKDRAERLKIR